MVLRVVREMVISVKITLAERSAGRLNLGPQRCNIPGSKP